MARPATALALLAVAAVFAPGLGGAFVYDDLILVERNPALRDPLDLGALLLEPLYGTDQGYWRPLTSLVLALGSALGGAPVLHAVALLLHLGAVVLVAGLGRDLGVPRRTALLGAVLFGVCPVVVEPVAWIAAINDPLWALAGLAALRAHLRWRRHGAAGVPWRAAGWLGAALLAKEHAVSVVLLALAADLTVADPARPRRAAWLRAYGAYLAVGLGWLAARALVLGPAAAGAVAAPDLAAPWLRRVEVAGRLLRALVWPADPTPFTAPSPELGVRVVLAAAAALAALAVAGVLAWRRRAVAAAFAVAAFAAVVAPVVAALGTLGPYPIGDRYLYLAAAAASLGFASVVVSAAPRWGPRLLVAAVVGLGAVSMLRVGVWHDQQALVEAGLTHHPDDPRLHYMAGRLRLEEFAARGAREPLDAATARFREASRLLARTPWNGAVHAVPLRADVELGLAWAQLGYAARSPRADWRAVVGAFERVAAAHPNLAPAHVGLGVALASAGRPADARAAFEMAVEADPRSFEARVNLGRVLAMLGEDGAARRELGAALDLRPGDPAARALLDELDR